MDDLTSVLRNHKKKWFALVIVGLLALGTGSNTRAQSQNTTQKDQFWAIKKNLQTAVDSMDKAGVIKAKYEFRPYTKSSGKELKALAYYYMGYADYRLNTQFPDLKEDQKERFLDEAVKYLEQAVKFDPEFADAWALLGSAYGMKATGIFAGMKYGPKSDNAMEKALQYGPGNPRAHMLNAIGLLYKPSMFGGSTDGAIEGFKKAAELYKTYQPKNKLMPDWGHAEVYAWLGQAYQKNEQFDEAKKAYQQALEVDPNYGWVKYKLMPGLAEKMN